MRKSKEERIIEHGDYMLKELHRVYKEGIAIDEYYKLLKEYKKLLRRHEKMIKLSDNMGGGIMEKNDTLSDNLQYTIQTARNKLMDNVTEHRKTKETSSLYHNKVKKLEEALKESYSINSKLDKQLKTYIKHYGQIQHSFSEELKTNKHVEFSINPKEYKNMNIKQVIAMELSKNRQNFVLAKICLDDFDKMIETIEESSSINNFLLGTYKYFKNSLHKNDIVFHSNMEEFYVICRDKKIQDVKSLMNKLNVKRKVLNFDIIYTIGITQFIDEKDTNDIFLRRCDNAFLAAQKANTNIVVR
mgnify:CR=1 FL=1